MMISDARGVRMDPSWVPLLPFVSLVEPSTHAVEILHGPGLSMSRVFEGAFPGGLVEDLGARLGGA